MTSLLQKRLEQELLKDLERGTIVWNELGSVNRAAYARRLGVTRGALSRLVLKRFDDLGSKKAPAEELLRSMLEEDFQNGCLVFSKPGFINKLHYARRAGCSNPQYYKGLFSEYETKFGQNRTADLLNELLAQDFDNGTLKFSRGGKIDRTSYARRLGVKKTALTTHIALFTSFEDRLGGAKRYRDDDLQRMGEWLETNFLARTLRTRRNGRLVRAQFKAAFGITHSDFESRFPEIGILIGKYDVLLQQRIVIEAEKAAATRSEDRIPTTSVGTRREGDLTAVVRQPQANATEAYPELEKHQCYDPNSTRGRLVAALNEGLLSGDIPRSRGGKIDRRGLCRKFGFANSAMNHYRAILNDYENATGGLANIYEHRLPEMGAWLCQSFEQGTLEIRDWKVERRTFYRRFGIPDTNTVLIRNPGVLALLQKYDEQIRSTRYLPIRIRAEVDLLKAALEDDPPIFKTGLSFDRTTLSKTIGISIGRLVRSPFKEILDEADAKLGERAAADELCHIFAGRLFSFRSLLDLGWSSRFLTRIAEAFQRTYRSKRQGAAKDAYNSLMGILQFVATADDSACRAVKSALNTGNVRSVREQDWMFATQLYAGWIDGRDDLDGATPKTKLKTANRVLRHLANASVLPELEMSLRTKGEAAQHRRTLAQGPSRVGVDDYLAFATAMLHDASKLREIEIDADAETGFIQTLRKELSHPGAEVGDTPASVILRVLKRRLSLIEDALAALYTRWRKHWERGQELLASSESLGDDWSDKLVAGSRNEHLRRTEMRAFFPLEDPNRAVGNLIRLVSDHFYGLYPRNEGPYGQFFAKRALEFGGKPNLEALITPHHDAVGAVVLLYLTGSGGNVAVGRTLFNDSMEASQITGATHITGEKARARGKPIHAHLDDRSHAVQGMKWVLEACSGLRSLLDVDDRKLLFVGVFRAVPKPLEEWFLRDLLKRVVADIPEIAEFDITPAMLRPTVLLIAALEGDANAHTAAALGQHGLNVNQGYTDHPPTRFMRDGEIRDFVDGLEIVSFYAEEDAQEWLGYSKQEVESKLDRLMETGLGTLCRDLHGRPGNDGAKCKTFDCWNNCPQLVVIARKRDLAFLIIWRASLVEAEAEWVRDRPERWYGLWFPWLEFIKTVERKILLTAMGRIWREALASADQVMAHPNFKPRRPY
ncbi:hypothetical protein [Rhizobium anhuiense]